MDVSAEMASVAPASAGGKRQFLAMPGVKVVDSISTHYIFHKEIGHGKFGKVFLAEDRLTGERLAVKKVLLPKKSLLSRATSSEISAAQDELEREARISHLLSPQSGEGDTPLNVVHFRDMVEDRRYLYIAMDLYEGGTLAEYLQDRRHGKARSIGAPAVLASSDLGRVFSAASLADSDVLSVGGSSDGSGGQSPDHWPSQRAAQPAGRPEDNAEAADGDPTQSPAMRDLRDKDERRRTERREREDEAAWVLWELASAVAHLHRHGVLHRDIKPENILLKQRPETRDRDAASSRAELKRSRSLFSSVFSKSHSRHPLESRASASAPALPSSSSSAPPSPQSGQRVVLADFGLAEQLSEERPYASRGLVGSPAYVAPEVAAGLPVGFASDVWGLGIVLYFMLADGQLPFSGRDTRTLLRSIRRAQLPMSSAAWALASEEARAAVRALLAVSPKERPTAEQVMQMPWVAEGHARWVARHQGMAQ